MRIACMVINNFPVQVVLRSCRDWQGHPMIIGGLPSESKPVRDASPEATAFGIKSGMPLRQAYALCPDAKFLPLDERGYEEAFEEVISILESFSPVVDVQGLGYAYIDAVGVPSEANLADDIAETILNKTGLKVCLGIGNSKFVSRVAATSSTPESPVVVPDDKERDFAAPFPVDLLPCSEYARERLHLFGISLIGQLCQFSREVLMAQFGSEGLLLYELAHGIDRTPLTPRKKPEIAIAIAELDFPVTTYLQIVHYCQAILAAPLEKARAQGKACSELSVKITLASGNSQQRRLTFKQATVSVSVILDRLRTWLETITLTTDVAGIQLSLLLVRESGKRLYLWTGEEKRDDGPRKLASDLKARFGYQPLTKVQLVDAGAMLPERRFKFAEVTDQEEGIAKSEGEARNKGCGK